MPACGSGAVSPVGWRSVTLWGQPTPGITVLVEGRAEEGALGGGGRLEEPWRTV